MGELGIISPGEISGNKGEVITLLTFEIPCLISNKPSL